MNKVDKEILIAGVKKVKDLNHGNLLLMTNYCLQAYIKSLLHFGAFHEISKDVFHVFNEFRKIVKEQKDIMQFITDHSDVIDSESSFELLKNLSDLNYITIQYYYSVLSDICDACETNSELRARRAKKDFDTLIETDEYLNRAKGLLLTFDDINNFLNYSDSFWNYIEPRIVYVDSHNNDGEYKTQIQLDENNCIIDMKVIVPNIINLQTAKININEFKHAHDLYLLLGNKIDCYDSDSKIEEQEFVKKYVSTKFMPIK